MERVRKWQRATCILNALGALLERRRRERGGPGGLRLPGACDQILRIAAWECRKTIPRRTLSRLVKFQVIWRRHWEVAGSPGLAQFRRGLVRRIRRNPSCHRPASSRTRKKNEKKVNDLLGGPGQVRQAPLSQKSLRKIRANKRTKMKRLTKKTNTKVAYGLIAFRCSLSGGHRNPGKSVCKFCIRKCEFFFLKVVKKS